MKINKIYLNNFGSYQGENIFDTAVQDDKNIIIIGGKNGAGKTTLFTAIRICLYGFMSMGYKNKNSFYNKEIIKLINNTAKMNKPTNAGVSLHVSLINGQELDEYKISRSWILDDTLTEKVSIVKKDRLLNDDETADFQKYIFSLIPPDLFNLFFFDGEKIADFFMNEGADNRIKNAFLTLCGYDIFEIMRKNFKRVGNQASSSNALNEYFSAKEQLNIASNSYEKVTQDLINNENAIDNCSAEIDALDIKYKQSGGITQDEWNEKIAKIKDEEKKRETLNSNLKRWANDVMPFLMLKEQISKVKSQIKLENNNLKYENFSEILNSDLIQNIFKKSSNYDTKTLSKIKEAAFLQYGSNVPRILDLSFEKSGMLLSVINNILSFDETKIAKYKKRIKCSIEVSAKIRKELESSSISQVQEYMKKRAELYEKKSELLKLKIDLEQETVTKKENCVQAELNLTKVQSLLEADLKKSSINDIAAKSIVMLDKLQISLYQQQIQKVEKLFNQEIKILMRKTQFIDDIYIDNDFLIHIYKKEVFTINNLLLLFKNNTKSQVVSLIGQSAFNLLKSQINANDVLSIIQQLERIHDKYATITLPVEIDKTSLSNGEKQIFIMALYHSLVQLCNLEIPFIIDTPFARIDTEHRRNISKYFFKKLKGQVFVLSTNEEIDSSHIKFLDDKIAFTYILENSDNKKTQILKGSYFEEEL